MGTTTEITRDPAVWAAAIINAFHRLPQEDADLVGLVFLSSDDHFGFSLEAREEISKTLRGVGKRGLLLGFSTAVRSGDVQFSGPGVAARFDLEFSTVNEPPALVTGWTPDTTPRRDYAWDREQAWRNALSSLRSLDREERAALARHESGDVRVGPTYVHQIGTVIADLEIAHNNIPAYRKTVSVSADVHPKR